MLTVKSDFATRSGEIQVYFQFVCDIVEGNCSINPPMAPADFECFKKTAKANGFLLLYNLMESTIGNAIEAIFDELRRGGVRFDDCRIEVQRVILNNLRKHNVDRIHPKLSDISLHIVTETFRKKQLFSGNVDARKVRNTADEFGFAAPPNGHRLVEVKVARNDLAHGDKSFAEVGRDSTTVDLRQIESHVVDYLSEMLTSIETYLDAKAYLATPPPALPLPPAPP